MSFDKKVSLSIIPKERPKTPTWVTTFLIISLVCSVAVFIAYVILREENGKLTSKKQLLDQQIKDTENDDIKKIEANLAALSKKIKDFNNVAANHTISSNLFGFLKAVCHPRVQLTSLDFNIQNYQVTLGGKTDNFEILGQQILALLLFKSDDALQDVEIAKVALDDQGLVTFSLLISFSPKFFKP